MTTTWRQHSSVEDGIPLIERSRAAHIQIGQPQTIRRKPLSVRKSASDASPFATRKAPAKYRRISEDDHDGISGLVEHTAPDHFAQLQKGSIPSSSPASWSPPALRLISLSALLLFNLVLLIVLATLIWMSATRQGLGSDDGSALIFFSWRFAPTLVAVIYVFVWMMLVNDVDRTEPFARLANSTGSKAASTLLRSSGPWWSTLVDSIPHGGNNYHFSSVMLCAVTGYILGFLGLSPLSSALLSPRDVIHTEITTFRQPGIGPRSALQPALDATTYFRTIGNVLQNVTTSPWISDQYTIVPFWPEYLSEPPRGAKLPGTPQIWKTRTLVLQAELNCEGMSLEKGPTQVNYTYSTWPSWSNKSVEGSDLLQTIQMSSASGCTYGFAFSNSTLASYGASYWSSISNITIPNIWGYTLKGDVSNVTSHSDPAILLNYTAACDSGEVIISTSGWMNGAFNFSGQLCRPRYFQGAATVNATITRDASLVTVDQDEFRRVRQPVSDNMINITQLQESLLGDGWKRYFASAPTQTRAALGGPASLLGALYDFDMSNLMKDTALGSQIRRIRQRAFGETIQASLQDLTFGEVGTGEILISSRRVVMVQSIAIVIEAILFIHLLFIVWIIVQNSRKTRPLGLRHDTALTNTIISTLTSPGSVRNDLSKLADVSNTDLIRVSGANRFKIQDGELKSSTSLTAALVGHDIMGGPNSTTVRDPVLPQILTTFLTSLLGLLLGVVLITVAVLYWYSITHGLYQSAFVYQAIIDIDDHNIGTLAPYSIIPSLIAVAIGLWWGAIESIFRRVQPYIAMARRPTASGHGSGISYQSDYLLWAAYKASSRKHWILALVCVGAFFTQTLTIAMSALWQRQPSSLTSQVQIQQPLQLRQIPHLSLNVDSWKGDDRKAVLADLYENLVTNWMYSATIQLTLNGSEPPWSSSGWSFVPVDLSGIQRPANIQTVGNDTSVEYQVTTNVTVRTSALRARLECTPLGPIDDSWWLVSRDLTNATGSNVVANITGYDRAYEVGCPVYSNYTYFPAVQSYFRLDANESATQDACNRSISDVTSFVPEEAYMVCCPQGTPDDPGSTSIGYWTSNTAYSETVNTSWPHGLTVKWLNGNAVLGQMVSSDYMERLLWTEKPQLVAANCAPVIEKANASVTVDLDSGRVLTYETLDDAIPDPMAWADPFIARKTVDPDSMTYIINVTTSYGVLFLDALLGASSIPYLGGCFYGCGMEDLTDHTFNIKRPGLNVDYMTYSMLALANNDTDALLNPTTLVSLAQQTFSTFFQHFASSNVSVNGDGGWAFQRVNATLPSDLLPESHARNYTGAPDRSSEITNATASAELVRPIEILEMSHLAVWLCICILTWLLMTTVLIMVVKKRYFSPLLRSVDTLADVASMVAGSERYLQLARERGAAGLQADKDFKTRLGWFRTTSGEIRWGIELVADGVEFLSAEEVKVLMEKRDESLPYESRDEDHRIEDERSDDDDDNDGGGR